MNYLNIEINEMLRSHEFIGAEPVERATWLSLMGWCASQENSGRIEGARSWSDRKWQQLCGVTKEEAELESELYWFEGDDLIVFLYPLEKEIEVKTQRETNRANGRKGGRPKKQPSGKAKESNSKTQEDPTENPTGNRKETQPETENNPAANPTKTQPKSVKERNGRESKEKEESGSARARDTLPPPDPFFRAETVKLTAEVNSLHPHWRGEILGREELADFDAALPGLRALSERDWQALRGFMAAEREKPPGRSWPRSRREFLANFPEVLQKALDWVERTGPEKETTLGTRTVKFGGREGKIHRIEA